MGNLLTLDEVFEDDVDVDLSAYVVRSGPITTSQFNARIAHTNTEIPVDTVSMSGDGFNHEKYIIRRPL